MDYHEIDAIDEAIKLEIKAYNFYVTLATKCVNVGCDMLFSKFALEELKHKRILENFKLNEDFDLSKDKVREENILQFVMKGYETVKQIDYHELKKSWDIAIEKELKAIGIYQRLMNQSKNPDLYALFKRLRTWERSHFVYLTHERSKRFDS